MSFGILLVAAVVASYFCLIDSFTISRTGCTVKPWILLAGKPVEVMFEGSPKIIIAEQGELISEVAKRASIYVPFKCKQGRCGSCEVRLNGRGNLISI